MENRDYGMVVDDKDAMCPVCKFVHCSVALNLPRHTRYFRRTLIDQVEFPFLTHKP